jgi:hypothetical protein
MRSEIDVENLKIRGIIYQQNLGMDFESGIAVSYIGIIFGLLELPLDYLNEVA